MGYGNAALQLQADRKRTLVVMATNSFQRVGNDGIHKDFDVFDIWLDLTMNRRPLSLYVRNQNKWPKTAINAPFPRR